MHKFFIVSTLLLSVISSPPLKAIALEEKQEVKSDLRILDLLPDQLCPLAVNPAIPHDFIALSPKGKLDPYDWIYWGPKEVLQAYFENPASLETPLLRVKLSANVVQTGVDSFSNDDASILNIMNEEDRKEFTSIDVKWGDYPIHAIRAKLLGKQVFTAWVGLNDPESRWVLMFNLVYPEKKGRPNKKDLQLWESLLMKTTQLTDGDYFKAIGQDLQDGYTAVNAGGAKLKIYAEKRQSDGALQVAIIPEGTNVKFEYVDMMECLMGAKWKYGEPMIKVYGRIIASEGNFMSIKNQVTSIFYKSVPEFSFKKGAEKNVLIFEKASNNTD